MATSVLVTGAAGFAGSHLVELLVSKGLSVVALDRAGSTRPKITPGAIEPAERGSRRAAADVRWLTVNLLDRAAVQEMVREVRPTAIVHAAGAAHVGRSWNDTASTLETNVRATEHLLDALRREGLRARMVITSSAMVYRMSTSALTEDAPIEPASPYGLSKLAQEMLGCHAVRDGIDVTIARSFNHTGPRQDPSFAAPAFARQIAEIEAGRRAPELVVGNLEARRDLMDVRDTVRAYFDLLMNGAPGRPYNVCTGDALPIATMLEMLVSRARVRVDVRVDPALYRPNDNPVLLGDPSRIRREIGWHTTIPIERTLDDLLEYWRGRCASS